MEPSFTEEATLDGVRFRIAQIIDRSTDILLIGLLAGVYATPVVVVVIVVLLVMSAAGKATGGIITALLVAALLYLIGMAFNRRYQKRSTIVLEVRAGGLTVEGERLPIAGTTVLFQRLAVSARAVLVVHNPERDRLLRFSGLTLTSEEQARIEAVLDAAKKHSHSRSGGQVPAALQKLRE